MITKASNLVIVEGDLVPADGAGELARGRGELDGATAVLDGSHLTDSGDNAADIKLHLEGGGAQRDSPFKRRVIPQRTRA